MEGKKWIRSLSNAELSANSADPDFAREIKRRKKRNRTRPVKPRISDTRRHRSLLEDSAPAVLPSGKRSLL